MGEPVSGPARPTAWRVFRKHGRSLGAPPIRVRSTPPELKELFARVPLAGVKNSTLSTPELARQVRLLPEGARIFTGLSVNLFDAVGAGAAGAICPLVALMPRTARALLAAWAAGDRAAARGHQSRLCAGLRQCLPALGVAPRLMGRIVRSATRWGLPLPQGAALPHAGVKLALAEQGLIRSAVVRAPQPPLRPEKQRHVLRATAEYCELPAVPGARASSPAPPAPARWFVRTRRCEPGLEAVAPHPSTGAERPDVLGCD